MNLTDGEKDFIASFVENKILFNAVKKVLLGDITIDRIVLDKAESNEILGQQFRSVKYAMNIIETGFKELEKYVRIETKPPGINEAR